jgi:hypothetical protein
VVGNSLRRRFGRAVVNARKVWGAVPGPEFPESTFIPQIASGSFDSALENALQKDSLKALRSRRQLPAAWHFFQSGCGLKRGNHEDSQFP